MFKKDKIHDTREVEEGYTYSLYYRMETEAYLCRCLETFINLNKIYGIKPAWESEILVFILVLIQQMYLVGITSI